MGQLPGSRYTMVWKIQGFKTIIAFLRYKLGICIIHSESHTGPCLLLGMFSLNNSAVPSCFLPNLKASLCLKQSAYWITDHNSVWNPISDNMITGAVFHSFCNFLTFCNFFWSTPRPLSRSGGSMTGIDLAVQLRLHLGCFHKNVSPKIEQSWGVLSLLSLDLKK